MKKGLTAFRWIGVAVFALMALSSLIMGGFLAAPLFLLGGAIIAPLAPVTKLRGKLRLNKTISIVLAVVLLFAGAFAFPSSDVKTDNDNSGGITDKISGYTSKDETTDNSLTDSATGSPNVSTNSSLDAAGEPTSGSANTSNKNVSSQNAVGTGSAKPVSHSSVPAYSGKPYVTVNNNVPNFSAAELKTTGYESYSQLDKLGRTGVAVASVGKDTMPNDGEKRGDISTIKPTGWVQGKYDCISGGWLYNRCHLIGWQLSAENANEKNLITGTKYLNVSGMLPFENMVADYIKETGNHVAYRVTPIYDGNNLLADGVQIEAYSVEDNGEGIQFNVFCYNVQPQITIDYATGKNTGPSASGTADTAKNNNNNNSNNNSNKNNSTTNNPATDNTTQKEVSGQKVYRTPSGKRYHLDPDCGGKNSYEVTLKEAKNAGLTPCKKCAS